MLGLLLWWLLRLGVRGTRDELAELWRALTMDGD